MALNEKEKLFLQSIDKKIKDHSIPITLKEALAEANEHYVETTYNNGRTELVNAGIEWFLCSISPFYFIKHYCFVDFPGVGVIPFNLYYFQEECLKLTQDYKKLVFLKSRQCLTEDNFVMTNRGYISIKDVKPGDRIETIVNGKSVFTLVENFINQGEKEVCRILTNSGSEVKCTLDHEILTKEGWKEAKDLTLKDEIVSLIGKGSFGDFNLENDGQAALIGYYLADGRSSQPSFVNTNIDYINEVTEIGRTFENCDAYIHERKDDKRERQAYDVRLVSKTKASNIKRPILDFIKRFNLNKKSVDRIFTNEVMNLNEKQMSIMLNRLFAGDGYITYNQVKNRPKYIRYEIGIGAPNYTLLKQIEYILQTKYGIHCWINEQFDKRFTQKFWKLRITQKKSIIDFINKIGIKGKTDTKEMIDLISNESPYKSNQSFEKIRKLETLKEKESVYDITTSTNDFLSNNLMVHNCGISTVYSLYCFWRGNFKSSENIDVISTRQEKAQKFVEKMKPTMDRLPAFLKTPITNSNLHGIKWSNGSYILSETASEKAGRGDSLSLLILDEAAHYLTNRLTRGIIASAVPTLSRTGGSMFIISTPNGIAGSGSYYYEQVNQLKLVGGRTDTSRLIEIDWFEIPDMEGIKPYKNNNKILNKYIEKDYFDKPEVREEIRSIFRPIEKNWQEHEWLKAQHDDLGDVLFKQEVLHSFLVGDDQVFSEDILLKLQTDINKYKPIQENEMNGSPLKGMLVWNLPIPKHRYIIGCLPPGEKVLTQNGLKNIEEIDINSDMLYDKKGDLTSIKNKQVYNADENIYKIKIEGIFRESSFTGEHPIITSKHVVARKHGKPRELKMDFGFSKVEDIEAGDWLKFPNFYRNKVLTEKEILSKWNETKSGRYDFDLNENIALNEEFWWFVGMWLADGWIQNYKYSKSIHTCHNYKKERFYADRVKNLFLAYDRKVGTIIREEDNLISTHLNSSQLHSFLETNFGKYAGGKNIPEWVKFLPEKYKIKLIEGYYNGDGCLVNGKSISFVSVSQKLMEDVQDILFSIGVVSSLSLLRREGIHYFPKNDKTYKTKKAYQLHCGKWDALKLYQLFGKETLEIPGGRKHINNNHFSDDLKYIYLKIKKITTGRYKGKVYNFETEDHTYLCNYLTTHNCDVSTGTGNDFSTVQIMDVESYEQVAEFKGKLSTKNLGRLVKKIARYYNQAFVVIECNSIGEAVFNEVYYHDTDSYSYVYKKEKTKDGVTRMTGWETTPKTRQLMVNNLIDWFNVAELYENMIIKSPRLYGELSTWVWKRGRPDHEDNYHDDSIIAWALCLYLRNKADSYGESLAFVAEDGSFIEFDTSKDNDIEVDSYFGDFVTSESKSKTEELIKDRYGVESVEQYKWLIH